MFAGAAGNAGRSLHASAIGFATWKRLPPGELEGLSTRRVSTIMPDKLVDFSMKWPLIGIAN